MEDNSSSTILDGHIVGIRFGLATQKEICTASISDSSIGHPSQLLGNPFLGLPLEFGRCESCGTSEPGKCEGHFGYIELPIPIYHPSHISELKKLLSLLCLKCLKLKRNKFPVKDSGVAQKLLPSCCGDIILISIEEVKTTNGACCLQLKLPAKFSLIHGFWNFLERYGFRYGDRVTRTLLPCEVKEMLKKIPAETRKKLAGKGYFPQDGYILDHLPVPPNCLSVPDISDGVSVMSSDLSLTMLKKVLKQVEIIKRSRSGAPNFESHEVEAADLQSEVGQYLEIRGTSKASRDIDARYGISQDSNSSTKAWLEKMRTLFIRKGSGFSSRSVITGDTYKRVNEIGVPFEIAQRITFEETVNSHNIKYLQELVDNKLCLTYGDGSSRYSLREGSKGHTFLRIGQVVHRRIMDGDIVFINRPPTTHKHSLQALSVYIHDDHTVKINPLICGPLSADFDGDCIHLFYPQSLAAKAEVVELFSVEKQLLSSHSGHLNLQLATDSLLSLKVLFKKFLLKKEVAQQLAMFVLSPLPPPALLKCNSFGSFWTALQMLQTILPDGFDCCGDRYLIRRSEVLELDFNRDIIPSLINEIVTAIFFENGPVEVLRFFDSLQPFLMENLFMEGFSVGLEDFSMSKAALHNVEKGIQKISPLLHRLRATHNELAELQLEKDIRNVKSSVAKFILNSSALGDLMDSKSDSAVSKVVQQIGFLGLQLLDRGKFYSKTLFEDVASHFEIKYPLDIIYPSAKYGLVKGCFFHGLDPYEEMVHSICTREIIVRSSRGLSEPGTLFKNLMAVLRDVVICYDGTVRHFSSNSIIQFEYGVKSGSNSQSSVPAGEPVGVLAATAMSNPAYKAVLDSSPSSNSSWDMMKEILLCTVGFKNDVIDRRVILYLNACDCGRKYCQEHAAYVVKNHLKRVSLKDTAVEFLIEYKKDRSLPDSIETDAGLVAHAHLNQARLKDLEIGTPEILHKCQDTLKACCKKKKLKKYVHYFKNTFLSVSESCSFQRSCGDECSEMPCLMFFFQDASENQLDKVSYMLANIIYPVLLDTIIKGDPRISSANIIWISPDSTTWIRSTNKTQKGELAIDVVLEKSVVKQSGDAWRIILDSCLPVLHLIDTRRSVPYAIKQIQELLGIACAFEQAVQRLSTSVTTVAKDVLKEHLILLANSMTCTGNLLGFNSGGYKALSRSLNVQVPFTEATLFTPRKCFERAAEKCHTDNLSSVVASVSWGKNVAVGTGSKFDILLDPKMVGFNQEGEMDVYNFLNMVRSSAGVEEVNNGCLGVEVDDLEADDEMDWNLSPERDSTFDKLVFEETIEIQNSVDNESEGLNWEKGSSGTGNWDTHKLEKSDSWLGWNKDETQDKLAKSDSCSGWNKDETQDNLAKSDSCSGWNKGETQDKLAKSDSWFCWNKDDARDGSTSSLLKESSKSCNWDSVDKKAEEKFERVENSSSEPWSGWGTEEVRSTKVKENRKFGDLKHISASWGKKNMDATTSWGRNATDGKSSWGKTSDLSPGWEAVVAWEAKAKDKFENVGSSVTKSFKDGNEDSRGAKSSNDDVNDTSWRQGARGGNDSSWEPSSAKGGNDSLWGQGAKGDNNSSWGQGTKDGNDSSWGQGVKGGDDSSWGHGAKGGDDSSWGHGAKGGDDSSWGHGAKGSNDSSCEKGAKGGNDCPRGQGAKDGKVNSWRRGAKGGNDSSWGPGAKVGNVSSWGQDATGDNDSSWGQGAEGGNNNSQGQSAEGGDNSSLGQGAKGGNDSSWGQGAKGGNDSLWGLSAKGGDDNSWGQSAKGGNNSSLGQGAKGSNDSSWGQGAKGGNDNLWGQSAKSGNVSSWGQDTEGDNGSLWGQGSSVGNDSSQEPDARPNNDSLWGQQKSSEVLEGWVLGNDSSQPLSSSWDLPTKRGDKESEKNQWGQPRGIWKGRKNNRPPKSPAPSDSAVAGQYTVTRQRLDMFTSEEQAILSDVEPIMQSIRRIMHQSGYNDGDHLSAEDKTFIVDNVFSYHPDKAVKMGAGIDYIMVNKHSSFQDSRCFFVVSIDGSSNDFSYRKCLENFIREKYPDLAEDFLGKYFRKLRSGGNRERSLPPLPEENKE